MTLHEAILRLLQQKGSAMTTREIADELNLNGWYVKGDKSPITAYQIHGRTKKYPNLFDKNGTSVSLQGQMSFKSSNVGDSQIIKHKTFYVLKDEHYVIDLCDMVLGHVGSRQHKFEFLRGDANAMGISAKLPVDSYYQELNLVIEYRERQHTESVNFFDKPNKITVSGVHRGAQRKIYDERRRQVLSEHKINLVEISYSDFEYDNQKRIVRNPTLDEAVVRSKLKDVVSK